MKKYKIIYADPPWRYARSKVQGAAEKHYPSMSIEELCALPVKEIADKDCILFLWATFPQLKEALQLIKAWGFTYKSVAFVWLKQNRKSPTWFYGLGFWTRGNAEICLLATKGHPKRQSNKVHQFIISPVEQHSKKPDITREKILALMGDLPRIELFARQHSLSVSDIVVLHQNDEDTAHYVDSIGFQQVPEFLQEQQTPVFDKLPPEQQQALSDTVQDTLQMLVDADKRIYGDVTGKTLEAIAAQGYSYKDGQLEKQQPEATPDSLLTGETVRTPRGNFHITDMSREQIEAAGFGFHHASEDGKYLIMGNGTQAYAIAAEQPQRDNPLKHVEDTIEQNDNNFDGLINNTPQTPTVADFEQRAKAGEAISVTDLAKAVKAEKREQPQKKPSILKKLDEYKKQAAQQPKDKQKEHKKDLEV
ncbi:MT-A70 family methyltransferase [Anaerovoracaceae bacterium HCP3S3_H6]